MQVNRGLAAQRAALQLAAAQQVELRLKVQKTLEHLQAKRAEAVEKEEWDRVLQMVSDTLTEELETEPSPWELSPDLLEEAELKQLVRLIEDQHTAVLSGTEERRVFI